MTIILTTAGTIVHQHHTQSNAPTCTIVINNKGATGSMHRWSSWLWRGLNTAEVVGSIPIQCIFAFAPSTVGYSILFYLVLFVEQYKQIISIHYLDNIKGSADGSLFITLHWPTSCNISTTSRRQITCDGDACGSRRSACTMPFIPLRRQRLNCTSNPFQHFDYSSAWTHTSSTFISIKIQVQPTNASLPSHNPHSLQLLPRYEYEWDSPNSHPVLPFLLHDPVSMPMLRCLFYSGVISIPLVIR